MARADWWPAFWAGFEIVLGVMGMAASIWAVVFTDVGPVGIVVLLLAFIAAGLVFDKGLAYVGGRP